LAVLVDRGGRELPIQADVVGMHHKAKSGDNVKVRLKEIDGEDRVDLE
ncbi:MAG: bifunctional pyr operon transcriptional regulator/uracil phosphoribosyltransferase, partial [Deltaproteobacteria bacterium]|nr:bifunctional pyr operon transcriptional regulator/uracil phosphoribosyltransferase [Deltaproteobacteria bacterium]